MTIRSDWLTHKHRDTLASIVGHSTLTSYLAIADGESIGRVKFEMTEVGVLVPIQATRLFRLCFSVCYNLAGHLLGKTRIRNVVGVSNRY